jgi:predicted transcriptional regulator
MLYMEEHILLDVKQLVIEIEPEIAARLERVAPSRSRRRSEFIRRAIRRALWELEEEATARAYREQPDAAVDLCCDARLWEAAPGELRPRSRRRR